MVWLVSGSKTEISPDEKRKKRKKMVSVDSVRGRGGERREDWVRDCYLFFSFRRDARAVLMGEEGRREHEREGVH